MPAASASAAATQAPPAVSNNADRRVTKRTEPLAS